MAIQSKTLIKSDITTDLADNTSGDITPASLRNILENMVDSYQDIFAALTQVQINALTPVLGQMVRNTDLNVIQYYNGAAWNNVATVSTDTATVLYKKVTLSSAQILASNTTPIELIAAPGAGYMIDVLSLVFKFNYNSIAYATNTSMKPRYDTSLTPFSSFDISSGVSYIIKDETFTVNILENKSVEIFTDSGDPTAGNSTIDIYLTYRIVTI